MRTHVTKGITFAVIWVGFCLLRSSPAAAEVLEEASTIDQSASPDLWLNSGARFILGGGFGWTLDGDLPSNDRWRLAYAQSNPVDTDNGFRPQNLFRLINRRTFDDFVQALSFTIMQIDQSSSWNRNASNGVFLLLHYRDENNLYVAGLRVDGAAVIKKKIGGSYFTLAQQQIYGGSYDRYSAPNLIPNRQVAIETNIHSNPDQTVDIGLSVDGTQVLAATDSGLGGSPLAGPGLAGIRTDFMNVAFSAYDTAAE